MRLVKRAWEPPQSCCNPIRYLLIHLLTNFRGAMFVHGCVTCSRRITLLKNASNPASSISFCEARFLLQHLPSSVANHSCCLPLAYCRPLLFYHAFNVPERRLFAPQLPRPIKSPPSNLSLHAEHQATKQRTLPTVPRAPSSFTGMLYTPLACTCTNQASNPPNSRASQHGLS